jgi:hypothetical protein
MYGIELVAHPFLKYRWLLFVFKYLLRQFFTEQHAAAANKVTGPGGLHMVFYK